MKKTIGAATLLAALASVSVANTSAGNGKTEKARMPSAVGEQATLVGCQYKDMKCVVPARSYIEDRADGNEVAYSYCPAESRVVQGNTLQFCVLPKPVML